jgi:hypothetical protein
MFDAISDLDSRDIVDDLILAYPECDVVPSHVDMFVDVLKRSDPMEVLELIAKADMPPDDAKAALKKAQKRVTSLRHLTGHSPLTDIRTDRRYRTNPTATAVSANSSIAMIMLTRRNSRFRIVVVRFEQP